MLKKSAPSILKAYHACHYGYERHEIIFARNRNVAFWHFVDQFNDGDMQGVSCTRVPVLDEYAGKPIPAEEMIFLGWWFECHNCGEEISEDNYQNSGLVLSDIRGHLNGGIYCSPTCQESSKRRRDRKELLEDKVKMIVKDRVERAFYGHKIEEHFISCYSYQDEGITSMSYRFDVPSLFKKRLEVSIRSKDNFWFTDDYFVDGKLSLILDMDEDIFDKNLCPTQFSIDNNMQVYQVGRGMLQ